MESLSRISGFMVFELCELTVMIFVYSKVVFVTLYYCSIQLLTYFILFRDQLHQTGQRATGSRGPAKGHTCGGGHEAPIQCPAWTFWACCHCHPSYRADLPSEKQEEQSVSARCTVTNTDWLPIHWVSSIFILFSALKDLAAMMPSTWTEWINIHLACRK